MTLRETMLALALGALAVVAADTASTTYLHPPSLRSGHMLGAFHLLGMRFKPGISFNGPSIKQ